MVLLQSFRPCCAVIQLALMMLIALSTKGGVSASVRQTSCGTVEVNMNSNDLARMTRMCCDQGLVSRRNARHWGDCFDPVLACWQGKYACNITSLSWSSPPIEVASMSEPFGLRVAPDGSLVVAETVNSGSGGGVKHVEFSLHDGTGSTSTLLSHHLVWDVALEKDGSVVFVTTSASPGDHSLHRMAKGGGSSTLLQVFSRPLGVSVAPNGDIIVSDYDANVLFRCPSTISTSASCTPILTSSSGLNGPVGVDVALNGDIFVVDWSNDRILRVAANSGGGNFDVLASPADGLVAPHNVAVAPTGHVVFVQFGDGKVKLCKFNSSNPRACASVETIFPGTGLSSVRGIALAPNGDIFVPDGPSNKIYRIPFKEATDID